MYYIRNVDIDKLANEDWLRELGYADREMLIKILRNLGFDRFTNFERDAIVVHDPENSQHIFSGIGVFDSSFLIKGKAHKGYNEIKKIQKIQEAQNWEKEWLILWMNQHQFVVDKGEKKHRKSYLQVLG